MRLPKSGGSQSRVVLRPEECPFDNGPMVLICDDRQSRLETIKCIAMDCGARWRPITEYQASNEPIPSKQFSCALVALDEPPSPNSPDLLAVRALSREGRAVICYADHASTWPVGKRCEVLLAGALTLFDSGSPDFAFQLKQTLGELVQWRRFRESELDRSKRQMRQVGIIGESEAMLAIFAWIERVSTLSDLPALITGETGTGKELIVNAIYRLDPKRSRGPFVVLNCGAIGAGVAESELFGHCRGAFTGANRDRRGAVRAAHGGVLFLDEIGDLDFALQAKLLRVLQENRVLRMGEEHEVSVDVRVLAATNRNLEEMMRNGTFRADLFHRLNILTVQIPPLRQRRADLRPLVEHFVSKHHGLSMLKALSIDPEFIEALSHLDFPGNARELENLVRRVLVNKANDGPLALSDLPAEALVEVAMHHPEIPKPSWDEGLEPLAMTGDSHVCADLDASLPLLLRMNDGNLARTLDYCERVLVEATLHDSKGNRSRVAKQLGITPRSVYNKLRKYHLG